MRVPALIQEELETCGFPFNIEQGTRHWKIFIEGKMCGIFPKIGRSPNRRAEMNVRAQIRRYVRELKGQS